MLTDPTAVFIYLAGLVGGVFWLTGLKRFQPLFKVTPAVIYAYFLPALSTSLGITPQSSAAYDWMVRYLLPLSLVLLMVTVDLRAIVRLGGKALIMMLAGSLGIIIGGPVALALLGPFLPEDAWMGMAALGGSWIGGAPNMVAIKESVGTPDSLMGPIIVVDTVVAYGWMGVLLFLSSMQKKFDAWLRADTGELDVLDGRLTEVDRERRPMEIRDMAMILGLGFGCAAVCVWIGDVLPPLGDPTIISHTTWTVVLVTTLGLALSFTPARRLEQVGASRAGYLALYLMLTAIGAQADLKMVVEAPALSGGGGDLARRPHRRAAPGRTSGAGTVVLRRHREHGQCGRGGLGADRGLGLPGFAGSGGRSDGRLGIPDRHLRGPGVRLAVVPRRRVVATV